MSPYDFDIAIIGGGSAGLTVAAGAAQFGAKTLLIERIPRGDCFITAVCEQDASQDGPCAPSYEECCKIRTASVDVRRLISERSPSGSNRSFQ